MLLFMVSCWLKQVLLKYLEIVPIPNIETIDHLVTIRGKNLIACIVSPGLLMMHV